MASGDTKTEAMLNALGNGGSADEFRGCCNTKTQQYILDAIDRVQNVEDEVEELKNNPDVVDIVDTYADLQAYDTSALTDKDIIRVLSDSTHSGNSTYYRWNATTSQFDFVGEIAGGGGDIKTLSTDDYNYPTNNPDRVALWLLPNGLYRIPTSGVSVYYASNSVWTVSHGDFVVIEKFQAGAKPISMYFFGSTDGVEYCEVSTSGNLNRALAYTILSDRVSQSTGNSQYYVMSQKAVTDALASAGGGITELTSADYNWPVSDPQGIAYWLLDDGVYYAASGVRFYYGSVSSQWNAAERVFIVETDGSSYKTATSLEPHQIKYYRNNVSTGDNTTGYPYTVLTTNSIVQTTGTSNTNAMSQNAVTSMVFADPATQEKIKIGAGTSTSEGSDGIEIGHLAAATGTNTVAVGRNAQANDYVGAMALGANSTVFGQGSIALGANSGGNATTQGVMYINAGNTMYGYNNSNYRLLTGLYDGQNANDAVTVGQVNSVIDAINTALSTNIPHIGA